MDFEDYLDRLRKASRHVKDRIRMTTNDRERNRLQGKLEGIQLALGYAYEMERWQQER